MKVKTNFKQMYLVDTMLYNKLTFKDNPSVARIDKPMNPNIHIHNKHAPPPYTPSPPTPPPPPPHQPRPLLPSHPSTSQLPTTSTPLFITTSPSLTSVLPTASSTHTTARIQPSVDFLNTIYDVDDTNVKEWMNNEQQNVKEWMNNQQQNVKDYRDDSKDTGTIPKQTTEPMEIEQTSSSSKNRNKLRGNMNDMKKVLKHNPTKLSYSEPLKSMLSRPTTPNITPHVLKLPQNIKLDHTPIHTTPQVEYNQPPPIQYNAPPSIDYNNPPQLQYKPPAHIEYNQPTQLHYIAPPPIDYNNPTHLQYIAPPPIDYMHPPHIQYNQPSPLQYNQLPQLEYKQTTPLTRNTSNENSQQCIECDNDDKAYDSGPQLNDDKTKITFKCTICNTDFKKKSSLMRHNKDFHDAFYQSERGIKRKTSNKGSVKKRVKTRGEKRKPAMIKHTNNKKPNTEIVLYEPYVE